MSKENYRENYSCPKDNWFDKNKKLINDITMFVTCMSLMSILLAVLGVSFILCLKSSAAITLSVLGLPILLLIVVSAIYNIKRFWGNGGYKKFFKEMF